MTENTSFSGATEAPPPLPDAKEEINETELLKKHYRKSRKPVLNQSGEKLQAWLKSFGIAKFAGMCECFARLQLIAYHADVEGDNPYGDHTSRKGWLMQLFAFARCDFITGMIEAAAALGVDEAFIKKYYTGDIDPKHLDNAPVDPYKIFRGVEPRTFDFGPEKITVPWHPDNLVWFLCLVLSPPPDAWARTVEIRAVTNWEGERRAKILQGNNVTTPYMVLRLFIANAGLDKQRAGPTVGDMLLSFRTIKIGAYKGKMAYSSRPESKAAIRTVNAVFGTKFPEPDDPYINFGASQINKAMSKAFPEGIPSSDRSSRLYLHADNMKSIGRLIEHDTTGMAAAFRKFYATPQPRVKADGEKRYTTFISDVTAIFQTFGEVAPEPESGKPPGDRVRNRKREGTVVDPDK